MRHLAARFFLLGSVVLAPSAVAQSATSNRLSGFVSDSLGVAVAFVEIRLTPTGGATRTLRTDAAGHFAITGLPAGSAQMFVRRLGYHPYDGAVKIGAEGADSLRLVLYVASAELAAIVGDIGAMEVYTSMAGVPAQYVDRENPCGAIIFWTRRR